MGLVTTSLRMSRAAHVRERALQRGRHTRAATKTMRVAKKEAMAGTGGARDGCDDRRRGMLDKSPGELHSEGHGVKTTGGARARRGAACWFRRVDVPDPQRGEKWWHGDVADARGALRSGRSGEKAEVTANYGSGGYSDRSGRCRDGTGCRGQRDGALRLGEVGGLHGRGDGIGHSGWHRPQQVALATADGIGHGGWQQPQRMAPTAAVVLGGPQCGSV